MKASKEHKPYQSRIQFFPYKNIKKNITLDLPINNGTWHCNYKTDKPYIKNWVDYQYETKNIDNLNQFVMLLLKNKLNDDFLFRYTLYKIDCIRNFEVKRSGVSNTPPPPPPPPPPPSQIPKEQKNIPIHKSLWDIYVEKYGMTNNEIIAIQLYTTNVYKLINKFLRERESLPVTTINEIKEFNQRNLTEGDDYVSIFNQFINNIVSGMKKWKKPNNTFVTRGIDLEPDHMNSIFSQHLTIKKFTENAFLSTSFGIPFAKDTIIILSLPKNHSGRNIAEFSTYSVENEILFPPKTTYEIVEVLNKGDEVFYFLLKWLIPNQEERNGRFKVVKRICICEMK